MTGAERKPGGKRCFCPYCDAEIAEALWPYCDACEITVFYCPKCRESIPRDSKTCPHCGAEIRG
ncbi:zinc-ribbon domain-containing protein [Chloroflexota bacterium]